MCNTRLLVVIAICFAIPNPVAAQYQSYDQMYGNVENAVNSGRIQVEAPEFDWQNGDHMTYSLATGCELADSPIGLVASQMVTVASIHKHRCPTSAQARNFWHNRVFPEVETRIREMFDLATTWNRGEDELNQMLGEKAFAISEIYQSKLNELAIQQGKAGARSGDRRVCAAYEIDVRIPPITSNAGQPLTAELKYMPNGYYLLWIIQNSGNLNAPAPDLPVNHPQWSTAGSGTTISIGEKTRIRFIVENNRSWEYTVEVPRGGGRTLIANQGGLSWQR